ncbi:MAG: alpha-glucosidase C-terminal domain-containing protein [Chloroflexi bacterium]|nr:alpha-glucosidase C-terminal domain-containing protein [Chloroflexota bacterium]
MFEAEWLEQQAARTWQRLQPRIETRFASFARRAPEDWRVFHQRLENNFPRLFQSLIRVYGKQYDFIYFLEELMAGMAQAWWARPPELKELDAAREKNPRWFQSNHMLGGVCYVDLFAGNLKGLRAKIPYFKELGLTYLHVMPLFKTPVGENDGGYAVSSYREVNPRLGTFKQLADLASELRREGISLVLDFVFNHTSNEHTWAKRAQAGVREYQEFYYLFPDRARPDAYERHLREIFPEEHPGAFTYFPKIHRWVWTTFHRYQWDLNYANPNVFNAMAQEMLALANVGVEALRLDAVAFIWKQLGTNCENLPEAHTLIQAFNTVTRIAAPAMIFKSEAIVHPDDVIKYIRPDECQVSYNPLLMALLWNSLATREVRLLNLALRERFQIPAECSWVNYVRCHDDIGWTFSDHDAARLGIQGYDHRRFLNSFYTGRFPGSFARGLAFQENAKTGDCRISGACASLAGLEKALKEETAVEVELAIRRIVLIHGIILTASGIPLIYLGDEIGALNDYGYRHDPGHADDSRWAHRPVTDWKKMARRNSASSVEGKIFARLRHLIQIRKRESAFAGNDLQAMNVGNDHVLGFVRQHQAHCIIVLANFSEQTQTVAGNLVRLYGSGYAFTDLVSGQTINAEDFELAPYQFLCLKCS